MTSLWIGIGNYVKIQHIVPRYYKDNSKGPFSIYEHCGEMKCFDRDDVSVITCLCYIFFPC